MRDLPREVVVMVDEAYYEFVSAKDYPQTLPWVASYPQLIVTRTFSKAYGLAGLRVGYGMSSAGVAQALEAVREPFNVNSLAQVAAVAALGDAAFLKRSQQLVREGTRFLTRELERLRIRYVPSATNFILMELGPRASSVAHALLRRGVIVREMSAWKLPGCIRVTLGTMPENRRFIAALKQSLTKGGVA